MSVYEEFLNKGLALHKAGRLSEAELIYNRVLNRMPFEDGVLFLLSDLYLRKEYNGLAINLLTNLLQKNPNNSEAWCNLGIGFRKEDDYENAEAAWKKAIEKGGETVEVCGNLGGLYADRCMPTEALGWCNKALKIAPDNVEARWQKALALLTLQDWAEGWNHYEARQKLPSWHARDSVICPLWDFKPVNHLYIHGEQGIGDEVMFLSVVPDVLGLAQTITVEVNPKVYELVRQTWPQLRVVTEETPGDYDAKIPLASLACRFRRAPESFPGAPYVNPDPERVAFYREALQRLGKPPYVALTWYGGTKATRVEERTITLESMKPIMDAFTCVSAQYFDTNPMLEPERISCGLPQINKESAGLSLAEQASLFKAVDAVVTVQQTAVHVAGAVGARTYALISAKPHWRYGVEGHSLPWYDSVKLYRNRTNWADSVNAVLRDLKNDYPRIQAA
jgi:hypothetical protein